MFEPLSEERVPSRIQHAAACIAFGRNPNSSYAYWSSCTITRGFDLHFHRAIEGSHLRVPGAREKKKTPHFFRLSCPAAVSLLPSNFTPDHVVNCAFSARSETSDCDIAAALPTIAILLRTSAATSVLLLLFPQRMSDDTVTYAVSSYPAPEGAKYVLLAYGGDTVLLLESCALHCYAMRPGDAALHRVRVQCDQTLRGRIVWVSARPSLRESCDTLLEILLLTDQSVVAAVSIRADGLRFYGQCVWGVPLVPTGESAYADKDANSDAQGLLGRWDTTVAFTRALSAPLPLLKHRVGDDAERTRDMFSLPPVVCASGNGAVLCVVPHKANEAFIVAIGSNDDEYDHIDIENKKNIDGVHGNYNANEEKVMGNVGDASVTVALLDNSPVRDAVWAGGGFVLLGSMLSFLPLVGRVRCLAHENAVAGTTSIFSHGNATDVSGAVRVRMVLRCVDAVTGAVTLRGAALTPPHTRPMTMSPHMTYWLMRFTGLAALNSKSQRMLAPVSHSAPGHADAGAGVIMYPSMDVHINNINADEFRRSMEVSLDALTDPFPSVVFPLRDVLGDALACLLDTLQRARVSTAAATKSLAVLRAIFAGVAAALSDAAVPSSAALLSRWLRDLHSVIAALRRALLVVARRGALSAVCVCVGLVASLAAPPRRALPQWRTLVAPLADDAVALLASCPPLARALVPHCSPPVRAMVDLAAVVAEGPAEAVDLWGTAQRIFMTEGADAVKDFLRCAGGDTTTRALCAGYDSVERVLVSAYSMA